jgi:hypothetical protein
MSVFTAILTPSADGTLHVPIPESWIQQGVKSVRISADIEPVVDSIKEAERGNVFKGFGCLRGKVSLARDFDEPISEFTEYSK